MPDSISLYKTSCPRRRAIHPPGERTIVYVYATLLTILNLAFWITILFGLPGTWLMLLAAVVADWLSAEPMIGARVLYACAGLALLGELLEFALGAAGSRKAGGSRRAAGLAIAGGVVGAVLGTAIPVPIVGTLLGACAGAFAGSIAGDLWANRSIGSSVAAGRGAAVGRFWGTVSKMAIGGAMFVLLAVAAYT